MPRQPTLLVRLAVAPLVLCACEALEPPAESQPPADLVLRKVVVDHTVRGEVRAKARFDELRYRRDQARLEGDFLQFEPIRDAVSQGVLTARHAVLTTRDGQGYAKRDVRFRAATGDTLTTPLLGIDLAREKAWSIEGVTVTGDGYEVRAPRFKATWDDEPKVRFDGDVKTVLKQPPPKPVAKPVKKPRTKTRTGGR